MLGQVILSQLISCDALLLGDDEDIISYDDNIKPPPQLGDGLEVSTLETEDIDAKLIHDAVRSFTENTDASIHSFLIVRNGKLVLESYFNGWNRKRRHDLRSATKSITSCLVGIAIDKGFIPSTDEPVFDFFSEYEPFANSDPRKETATIRHFLQMRTGLACDDWNTSSPGYEGKMYKHRDWIRFILDLPAVNEPGQLFSYCTGSPVTLGGVISKTSSLTIPAFSEEYLFGPLGITDYQWEFQPNGNTDTGGHIHLYPRDMAKFGLLFLNNGNWYGEQLVSEAWVAESTRSTEEISPDNFTTLGYGYLWWTKNWNVEGTPHSYFASGNGGQFIFVFPSLNAVIVFTGGKYNEDSSRVPFGNLGGRILKAFK